MKKIILTENQVKEVIGKLISEAEFESPESTTLDKVYSLTNSFPSGQFKLSGTTQLDAAIKDISKEIKQYPINSSFSIIIESSESRVPNAGVGLKPGQLSLNRANEIEKYLTKYITDNKIQNVKIFKDNKGAQGPTWDSKKGSTNPIYTAYQYVKIIFKAEGKKVCLINLSLNIDYDQPSENRDPHKCNYALFEIAANGIVLKTTKNTDADMNNGSTDNFNSSIKYKGGEYKLNEFIISNTLAEQILSKSQIDPKYNKKTIVITQKCLRTPGNKESSYKCHESVPHVTIKNANSEIIANFFPNKVGEAFKENMINTLCILDECGKRLDGPQK